MRELSATVIANRTHDLILDYIKEATKGLSKMSINRIRRAVIEKDEWDALKAFEVVASEQQKIYAKTFCKSALKAYKKKKKNIDLVAAHILYDIIPKILPQYDAFNLPMDENSLPSEQIQENRESIHKLSRDLRLQVTQLYLKIVQEEFEFQKERLEKLLEDFPPDSNKVSLTQTVNDEENIHHHNNKDDEEEEEEIFTQKSLTQEEEIFTQKPQTQKQKKLIHQNGSQLYSKFIEIALKRSLLETEREVHFLAERSVKETPFVIREARDLNPVLRKDFVLQA
ncbi:unnamed protein product [Rotaria sp. Silwood1]|nr:unnamed protein product [Rotaria sp. Silwood1]CAF1687194.1 unnamed protein product [Rotaria sp. Silwood1]CAF3946552.1 unnamed protein product [Rotaria sp. Silwood1]CAF4925988.1 unnamed protein product [Rotaria sp. Silwood1]